MTEMSDENFVNNLHIIEGCSCTNCDKQRAELISLLKRGREAIERVQNLEKEGITAYENPTKSKEIG